MLVVALALVTVETPVVEAAVGCVVRKAGILVLLDVDDVKASTATQDARIQTRATIGKNPVNKHLFDPATSLRRWFVRRLSRAADVEYGSWQDAGAKVELSIILLVY